MGLSCTGLLLIFCLISFFILSSLSHSPVGLHLVIGRSSRLLVFPRIATSSSIPYAHNSYQLAFLFDHHTSTLFHCVPYPSTFGTCGYTLPEKPCELWHNAYN